MQKYARSISYVFACFWSFCIFFKCEPAKSQSPSNASNRVLFAQLGVGRFAFFFQVRAKVPQMRKIEYISQSWELAGSHCVAEWCNYVRGNWVAECKMPCPVGRGVPARCGVRVLNCVKPHVGIGCRTASLLYRVVGCLVVW